MTKRLILVLASLMLAFGVAARKTVWVIDPGHGGNDVGCKTRANREKDITLAIAKEVGRLVRAEIPDVKVVYTRERDVYPTLQRRCDIANSCGAGLMLSIHVNDAENVFAHGTESYFAKNVPLSGQQAGKSELLALLLQRAYLAHGRTISRGVKQRALYVCENTQMPCVLTEVGFISNPTEEAFIASKAGQATLARAIVDALKQWHQFTRNGSVPRRDLRNLRFTYMDPRQVSPKKKASSGTAGTDAASSGSSASAEPSASSTSASAASAASSASIASSEASSSASPSTDPSIDPTASETVAIVEDAPSPADSSITFAIQIFSVAKPLPKGDKRLRGFKEIRYVRTPEGRHKALVGSVKSYVEARDLLSQVRESFADAFIVAFDGERQITTAEANRRLK